MSETLPVADPVWDDDAGASYLDDRNRALREELLLPTLLHPAAASAPLSTKAQARVQRPASDIMPAGRWSGIPGGSSPVLDDIDTGIAEAPRAVVRGFLDAAKNLIATGDELEMWLATLTPEEIAKLPAPVQAAALGARLIPQEWVAKWDQAVKAAPDKIIAPPTSVTGNLISGTIEFIAGMKVFTGALKGLGMAAPVEGALASGGSMATAFDPSEDTLAELMKSNPMLAKLVPDFLASQPGDTQAEKRLKNFFEGAALGVVGDGFLRALKLFKAAHAPALGRAAPTQPGRSIIPITEPAPPTGRSIIPNSPLAPPKTARSIIPNSPSPGASEEVPKSVEKVIPAAQRDDPDLGDHGDPDAALVSTKSAEIAPSGSSAQKVEPPVLLMDEAARVEARDNLRGLYERAVQRQPPRGSRVLLGPVTPEGAQRIQQVLKEAGVDLDVTEYQHEVTEDAARHTFKGHGNETEPGQVSITAEDWAAIPDILQAPDRIEISVTALRKGQIRLEYSKQVDGHVLYVEEVRTGKKTLVAKTMWKKAGKLDGNDGIPSWPSTTSGRQSRQ